MPKSIVMNSNIVGFVPKSFDDTDTANELQTVDTALIESQIRAELEAEFAERLEHEVNLRLNQERQQFKLALNQSATGFDQVITSLRKEIQNHVVDLAIRLSEVIVRHELPDRDMLRNLIVKTLEPISDLQGAMVRISSHDWALFGDEIANANGDHLGVGSTVKFVEDPNLAAGDVIVESRNGIFDARLAERLKLLKETLYEHSGRTSTEPTEL